jgi:hypothetical protein
VRYSRGARHRLWTSVTGIVVTGIVVTGIVVSGVVGPSETTWSAVRATAPIWSATARPPGAMALRALFDEAAQVLGVGPIRLRQT